MTEAADVNEVILALHRDGREVPLRRFRAWALERVRPILPFDSAAWGSSAAAGQRPSDLHLHDCDERIAEHYFRKVRRDRFHEALLARPGTAIALGDVAPRAQWTRTRVYRAFAQPFGLECVLGIVQADPVSSLHEFLVLWRRDPRAPFGEAERQRTRVLMPHLVESLRSARLAQVLRLSRGTSSAWALVDRDGRLCERSAAFIERLRRQWPGWTGDRLPDSLASSVRVGRAHVEGGARYEVVSCEPLRHVSVRSVAALARLTAREREIASRYARGETYSSIAAGLSLSPATVRNHIARCYRKLGVGNKVQLAARLFP